MPLGDGRFGACRVLRKGSPAFGAKSVLVVATTWIGHDVPDLSAPMLKQVLLLNHHAWQDDPAALWTSYPVPADFTWIGTLAPTPADAQRPCHSGGTWDALPIYVLDQWRWDHERAAVLREDKEQAQAQAEQREMENQRRRAYLDQVTIEALADPRRFASWEGVVPQAALRATRQIFRDTIDAIIASGPGASEATILETLRGCIASLNALDMQHGGFIETIEREDLCEAFEEIVHASGLGHHENLVDAWREW